MNVKRETSDSINSEMSNVAYAYDAEGYYIGLVRRQIHPKKEKADAGIYLLPANSTALKPVFMENFKPKFDGVKWNLEAIRAVVPKVPEKVEYSDLRQEILDQAVESVESVVSVRVQKSLDEKIGSFLENQSKYQGDILGECRAIMIDEGDRVFAEVRQELMKYTAALTDHLQEIHNLHTEIQNRHAETLMMASQVESRFEVLNRVVPESPGLWAKLLGMFVSKAESSADEEILPQLPEKRLDDQG